MSNEKCMCGGNGCEICIPETAEQQEHRLAYEEADLVKRRKRSPSVEERTVRALERIADVLERF